MGLIIGLAVPILILVMLFFWVMGIYNKLVKLRVNNQNMFSQIDVQLKRRYDLIPNLVETAKGYMTHEKEALEAVMAARASATQAQINVNGDPSNLAAMQGLMGADNALTGALGRLMAVSEAYPDLKANQNMMQLSEELTSTENKVSYSRQGYNDSASMYNAFRQSFPAVIFAGMFNFQDAEFWDLGDDEASREAPKVSF